MRKDDEEQRVPKSTNPRAQDTAQAEMGERSLNDEAQRITARLWEDVNHATVQS